MCLESRVHGVGGKEPWKLRREVALTCEGFSVSF